jgi:hypothetical protein
MAKEGAAAQPLRDVLDAVWIAALHVPGHIGN